MNELDPQAVNLAKAIRQTESGGDFKARGKSGEYGAYQFTPDTWNKTAPKYGVNVPLDQATPEHQNEVAYKQIKEWKDAGNNVGQIASMWNAGEAKPNAYLEGNAGVNKSGAKYDTGKYAESVAKAYQTLKSGGQVGADPNNPSSIAAPQSIQPQPDNRDFLQKAGDIVNTIFPGKQIGEAIGNAIPQSAPPAAIQSLTPEELKRVSTSSSAPTPLQVAGDIGQIGLMTVAPELMPEAGALGRIGQNALLGAGFGASGAIAGGNTNPSSIAKQGLVGGALGGAVGSAGELVNKAVNYLPKRLVDSFVPGLNDATKSYAIKKGLASPEKMLTDSESSINQLGTELGDTLKKYEQTTQTTEQSPFTHSLISEGGANGQDIIKQIMDAYPDSGLDAQGIIKKLKSIVPLKASLVDALGRGQMTLDDLHELNSALGASTFKSVFDNPAVKAGKQLGNTAYQAIKQTMIDKTGGAQSPLVPLFEQLTREYQLRGALQKAVRRGQKAKFLDLKDILIMMGALGAGGIPGAGAALAVDKALTSPTLNMKAAGLMSRVPKITPRLNTGALKIGTGLLNPSVR